MTPAEEVQHLLRFLTKEAKVPLATAMSKIHELRKANLASPDLIAKTSLPNVQKHFADEKVARQVFNAAKRIAKKQLSGEPTATPTATKRGRGSSSQEQAGDDPVALEESLELPISNASEDELRTTILQSNRAPLVLAFAVMLLKYTMPEQPLSSRLSLAQANVSMNSKSKAQAIGIDSTTSAEQEGWGQGQPTVKVLGRPIPVMRRAGYGNPLIDRNDLDEPSSKKVKTENNHGSEDEIGKTTASRKEEEEALWGLDLEALRKSNGPILPKAAASSSSMNGLPIYSPHSARSYLLRSFTIADHDVPDDPNQSTLSFGSVKPETHEKTTQSQNDKPQPPKKKKTKSPSDLSSEKEHALSLLLQTIDIVLSSWAPSLTSDDLDKRCWSWYISVRPDVAQGDKGWGQKGEFGLGKILALKRKG